jgi:methionyl-tRNA synthetase
LADILGNFVHRTVAFCENNFDRKVPPCGTLNKLDREMLAALQAAPATIGELYEHYRFRDGVMETMNVARAANKYFHESQPWKTLSANPEQCATTIHLCLQTCRTLAILFEPVIPTVAQKIWSILNFTTSMKDVGWDAAAEPALVEGHLLNRPEILVTKIEDAHIESITRFLESGELPTSPANTKPMITIDDFKKIDLRVARVLHAEQIPKSEKLLKLKVDLGTEQRQVVAGIAQHYRPEQLLGKLIVVVANLQPTKLMGQESQGMLLAANDDNGKISIVTVLDEPSIGSVVR